MTTVRILEASGRDHQTVTKNVLNRKIVYTYKCVYGGTYVVSEEPPDKTEQFYCVEDAFEAVFKDGIHALLIDFNEEEEDLGMTFSIHDDYAHILCDMLITALNTPNYQHDKDNLLSIIAPTENSLNIRFYFGLDNEASSLREITANNCESGEMIKMIGSTEHISNSIVIKNQKNEITYILPTAFFSIKSIPAFKTPKWFFLSVDKMEPVTSIQVEIPEARDFDNASSFGDNDLPF